MAAPSTTVWGPIVTGSGSGNFHKGRIGIYVGLTNTSETKTKVNVQVWFWSIYSCSDSSNTLYYDVGTKVSSATTSMGSVNINHTDDSGNGWSTNNQTKILDKTYSYTRGTSAVKYTVFAKLTGIGIISNPGTMNANASYTIPALLSYTVSYNANGGLDAPSSQTKWYGVTLTLSNAKPLKLGYRFKGWATSKNGSVVYTPGSSYTANAGVTLYAVWQIITYTVSYDANGGSGAPSSQTKTYGVNLTLSSTKPTRTNYKFLGWGLSASSTTVSYSAGATYSNNSSATLYAIWELAYTPPSIKGLKASRCNSDGTINETGTYAKIQFSWECNQLTGTNNVSSIVIQYKSSSSANWGNPVTVSASGYAGTVSSKVIGGSLDLDTVYNVKVIVKDSLGGETPSETIVPVAKFVIDFLSGGGGVAFGKPASIQGAAEFNFDIYADKNIYDKYGTLVGNGLTKYTGTNDSAIDPDTTLDHCILTNKNVPMADSTGYGSVFYIITYFFYEKTTARDKTQIAVPYRSGSAEKGFFFRYKNSGTWSAWVSNALQAYPVNSIYISYSNTSPAELFGGTWTRIGNRFLWGCDSSGTIGKTGGSKTHTLTVDQIPSHSHPQYVAFSTGGSVSANIDYDSYSTTANTAWQGFSTGETGGGKSHNNMPPYISVAIWRRTA